VQQESGTPTHQRHARDLIEAFPQLELRILIIGVGCLFVVAAVGKWQSWDVISIAHAGCLMTLITAVCEWRMIDWRLRVDSLAEKMSRDSEERRRAVLVYKTQLRSASFWVHLGFGLGTIAWGFG
jgi:hypothetical protein